MNEEQTLKSRRATREAHKVELQREIKKRPIRSSRSISIAAGLIIGFSIVCWSKVGSATFDLTPWAGLAFGYVLMTFAIIFALGRAWERGRTFDIMSRG